MSLRPTGHERSCAMRSLSSISVVGLIVLTPMGFESVKAASGSGPAERRAATTSRNSKPVPVGRRKQLLVDDFVIAKKQNVTRKLGTVTKANGGKPIITDGVFYGSVLHNQGRFRMWYRKRGGGGYNYAESADGLNFKRGPDIKGINFAGDYTMSVSLDQHETDPAHRFKAAYDGPGMRAALAHSGDGIHWTPYNNGRPVTKRAADTCNQIFWDPHARLYRLFTRTDFGAAGGKGEIRGARSMTNTDVKTDIGLPKGTWIHVASVLKDDRVTMYLNGVAQTSYVGDNGKGKGQLKVAGTNVDFVDANTSFSGFGGEGRVRNDPWYFYNGLADDVAVWNVPLTSKQIAALAAGAATPTTLAGGKRPVSYWDFNDGKKVTDRVGNNHGVAIVGAGFSDDTPAVGGAHSLDLTNGKDYVSLPSTDYGITDEFTISAWLKVADSNSRGFFAIKRDCTGAGGDRSGICFGPGFAGDLYTGVISSRGNTRADRTNSGNTYHDIFTVPAGWKTVREWTFNREGPLEHRRRQIYSCNDWIYEGIHFGILSVYEWPGDHSEGAVDYHKRHERDVMNFYIGTSRDADNWDLDWVYAKQPLVPRGPDGAFDKDLIIPGSTIVTHDDRHWLYYGGANERHNAPFKHAIGVATLPLDRFICLEAKDTPGEVLTKPFRLSGNTLQVNVDARAGRVRVEVLDENSRPIPGFSGDDAVEYQAVDELRFKPAWKGQKDLSPLSGQVVRLRFCLHNARLFAFQLRK
ncbi:MAG TPA: hypothetical protein DCE39_12260 [Planctomycetaceae bacterium]|nr:hypothetical protein [Planctomycetaceae bacterium]